MNNAEWIQDCLIELISNINVDMTDEISDKIGITAHENSRWHHRELLLLK